MKEKHKETRAPLSAEELEKYSGMMREIFHRLGMEKDTESTVDTPRRYVEALRDMTVGYEPDPKIQTSFPAECRECADHELEQIVNGPVRFTALCEHHVLPFDGSVWIGVVRSTKHGEVLGLSKYTRIVRQYTRRFTLQERIAQEIAAHVMKSVVPVGVAVAIVSDHSCISSRGVLETNTHTNTFLWRGIYDSREEGAPYRAEFLSMLKLKANG